MTIRRTFDLTGYNLSTVGMTGIWRVADDLIGASLNGNLLFSSTGNSNNWASDNPFSVATGSAFFVQGINTLDFVASSGNSTWDGLYLNATVTGRATSAVPKPATLVPTASGIVLIGAIARRRRT